MATQSLYRRYRPRRFGEVKGQDHVVRALRTAVAEGREGQAYLFSGPRGTGKTTSARILAKVLNCEHAVDGEPCCECESCIAVERGTSYDVHELDAASNNGVDAMRDLIEKASLGTPGRHKVYILDEVHMLSKGAEAALLKTLEEPPPHVVFVLATTDPQKMSDTIRSRTQHLQFHLLPADTLQEHARWVAQDAGLDISEEALDQVLARGGGSARDTLSALELMASTGGDGMDVVPLDEFVEAMIDRDPGRALTLIAHGITSGMDSRTLTEELIAYLRNGFLALMAPELVMLPGHRLDAVAEQAQRLGAAGLVRGIEQLGTALVEMRHAPDPRVLLDVATVQLTADSVAVDVTALLTRLERLERQLAESAAGVPAAATSPAPAAPVDPSTGRAAIGGRARTAPTVAPTVASGRTADAAIEPSPPAVATPTDATSTDATPADASPEELPAAGPPPAPVDPAPADASSGAPAATPTDDAPAEAQGPTLITAEVWENTIRPSLRNMTRAIYAPVGFLRSTPSVLTLSVPNAVHRGKCEEHRDAVEAAVSAHAGGPVELELVDGDGGGADASTTVAEGRSDPPLSVGDGPRAGDGSPDAPMSRADARRRAAAAVVDVASDDAAPAPFVSELPDDDDVDLDDLVDAPPESVKSPIDRLAEAFPGSELIEEAG